MNLEQIYSEDEIRVQIFKALADKTRLDIIRILRNRGEEMNCGEIGEYIDIPK